MVGVANDYNKDVEQIRDRMLATLREWTMTRGTPGPDPDGDAKFYVFESPTKDKPVLDEGLVVDRLKTDADGSGLWGECRRGGGGSMTVTMDTDWLGRLPIEELVHVVRQFEEEG